MSTVSANTILDATGGNTATINGATPTVYNTMGKNLIINGAMQINQRGNSTGQTGANYQMDRWQHGIGSLGTWSSSQSTVAPDGFGNSWKMNCTTANASPSASAQLYLFTRLEGQNLQQIKKGTANAQPLTLSFWCRCNKTGNFQTNLRDADNTRQVGATVTINSADTWEYKTITFPADTTGALDNDNAWSMNVEFWLDRGSNYTGGSVPTAWEAAVNTDRAVGTTLALGDSTSNEFYITGVQLEVGSVATEFERRPYGTELQLCQRYYQKIGSNGGRFVSTGSVWSGNSSRTTIPLVTTMRSQPSATFVTAASTWTLNNGVNAGTCSSLTLDSSTPEVIWINAVTAAGLGGGTCALWYETANPGAAVIHFSAEL